MTVAKVMAMRGLGAALPLLLAACASQPQLLERPDRVWASPKGLDATASCVIRVLDDRGSGLPAGLSHARRVIEPGRIYEIRPEQDGAVTPESYFVRLEKAGDQITRMSLFAESPWKKDVIKTLSPCGTRS